MVDLRTGAGKPTISIDFYKQLFETAASFDELLQNTTGEHFHILSDDHCSRLLAYVYVLGGGNEAVVINGKLNAHIKEAQRRANLFGGKFPNTAFLPSIQKYVKELEEWINSKGEIKKPKWFQNFETVYSLKHNNVG
jgi:hypothetical protein